MDAPAPETEDEQEDPAKLIKQALRSRHPQRRIPGNYMPIVKAFPDEKLDQLAADIGCAAEALAKPLTDWAVTVVRSLEDQHRGATPKEARDELGELAKALKPLVELLQALSEPAEQELQRHLPHSDVDALSEIKQLSEFRKNAR